MNRYYKGHYDIEPLLELIDQVINPLHKQYGWGYSPEYYLSSVHHCSPSYAGYFSRTLKLPIETVGLLLTRIPEEKRISFDRQYAGQLYETWRRSF